MGRAARRCLTKTQKNLTRVNLLTRAEQAMLTRERRLRVAC